MIQAIPIVEGGLWILTGAYAAMMLTAGIALMRTRKLKSPEREWPFVSVIVAVRNEEQHIERCIRSLMNQDYPSGRFEILISDDHSSDRTVTLAQAASRQTGPSMTVLRAGDESAPGKKQAIRRACSAAQGEWILTTDGDTERGPQWIRSLAGAIGLPQTRMVLGPVQLTGASWFQRLQQAEFTGIMGLTAGSAAAGVPLMCNGANLLYRKGLAEELKTPEHGGAFASGDDQFLLNACTRQFGGSSAVFAFHREAVVTTEAEKTWSGFLHQRMRWVSKSKGYRHPWVLLAGGITWMTILCILASLIAGLFSPGLGTTALLCLGIKMIADLPLTLRMSLLFKKLDIFLWFVPAQLFQLLYAPAAALAGWLFPYRWKDRLISA